MPKVSNVSGPQPALRKWKSFLRPNLQLPGFLRVCVPRAPPAQDSQGDRDATGTIPRKACGDCGVVLSQEAVLCTPVSGRLGLEVVIGLELRETGLPTVCQGLSSVDVIWMSCNPQSPYSMHQRNILSRAAVDTK